MILPLTHCALRGLTFVSLKGEGFLSLSLSAHYREHHKPITGRERMVGIKDGEVNFTLSLIHISTKCTSCFPLWYCAHSSSQRWKWHKKSFGWLDWRDLIIFYSLFQVFFYCNTFILSLSSSFISAFLLHALKAFVRYVSFHLCAYQASLLSC